MAYPGISPISSNNASEPYKLITGGQLAYATTTTLTIAALSCRDSANELDINIGATTLAPSAVGLNGLDTGTFAATTMYNIFAICDQTQKLPSGYLLSVGAIPTLPFGYSNYRLVGHWATNSSTHFYIGYYQAGNGSERKFTYDSPVSVLSGGAATAQTAVSLVNVVPAVNNLPVILDVAFTPGAASRTLTLLPSGSSGTSQNVFVGQVTSVVLRGQTALPVQLIAGVPKFDYLVTNAGDAATIYVDGFVDNL